MDCASVSIPFGSGFVVCRSAAASPRAGGVELGFCVARHCMAGRVFQPAILPHGYHAKHGAKERAASRQNVPSVRGHQKIQRGLHVRSQIVSTNFENSSPFVVNKNRTAPRDGAYVNGLFMEGARWDTQGGVIMDSRLKELFPPLPVINIKVNKF